MIRFLLIGTLCIFAAPDKSCEAGLIVAQFEVQADFKQLNEHLFRRGSGTGVEIVTDEFDHTVVDSKGVFHQVSASALAVGGSNPLAEVKGATILADGSSRARIVYQVGVEKRGQFFPDSLPVPVRVSTAGSAHALYANAPFGGGSAGAAAFLTLRRGPDPFSPLLFTAGVSIIATGTNPEQRAEFSEAAILNIAAGSVVRVEMTASGGVSHTSVGFTFARSGEFEAIIDPVFEIDPFATFLFNGTETRFSDAYGLQYSEGIEPFTPTSNPVPEPASLLLFTLGSLGLLCGRRKLCPCPP